LGGFTISFAESLKIDLPPFSFKVDGVTSISIDHHKFGLAPKGVSAIFYKTKKLRQSQYYIKMDWCGGVYGTPTMVGSRNAVGSAGAWFAFNRITYDGYKQNAL
jgi:sphinganine-1-phosphate aldolase